MVAFLIKRTQTNTHQKGESLYKYKVSKQERTKVKDIIFHHCLPYDQMLHTASEELRALLFLRFLHKRVKSKECSARCSFVLKVKPNSVLEMQ